MEAELQQRLVKRDESALSEIYDLLGNVIYGLALKVIRDRHIAQDITQEVFVFLWEHPDRFDPERGTLRSWLCTLTHRRSVDAVRKIETQRRHVQRHADEQSVTQVTHEDEDDSKLIVVEAISEILNELPYEQASAIQLAYFEGKTYRGVADALGIPEGTAKSRIRLGLQHLRSSPKLRKKLEMYA